MGGGGKGGSTTTSTVQIPPEVLARYNAVNARADTVAQQPYQAYSQDPNAFVAPLTSTQQAGIANTNAMAGAAQPYYANATNQLMQAQAGVQPGINNATQALTQGQQQGQNYLGAATNVGLAGAQAVNPNALDVNQYMNPFTQNVVNATQAAMNQQQGQQLSQQQSDAIRGGAFGGDRANLQRGALMGQQSLAQAQAISPLYQQNYNQALAAAQQQQGVGLGAAQANRAALQNYSQQLGNLGQQGFNQGLAGSQQYGNLTQQGYNMGANTAQNLASLGTNAQQAGLAGAQAQMAAGQAQQQTQQAGLQALYNQFQQGQAYPFQVAQFLANIAEGTGALSGNTTTSTTSGGGGFFSSDRRLKENVQKVGKTNDGQPIYRFNYKGDPRTQIGLMAQDVEKSHPDAVGLAGGYKTVNYKKATDGAVRKADGGSTSNDAYSMSSPSALLQDSGKGLGAAAPAMTLPHMVSSDEDMRNNAATFASRFGDTGANAAAVEAMRAPRVGQPSEDEKAGYSLGTLASKRDQLSSLMSSQGRGDTGLGSGPGYTNDQISQLQKFLAPYQAQNTAASSQGGLVAAPGDFARGGFAGGGYTDPMGAYYHNAALDYYGPQGAQNAGLGAIIAQGGGGARSLVPAQAAPRPPQKDPIAEANQMAGLATNGAKFYDWAKSKSATPEKYDNVWTPRKNGDAESANEDEDALIDLETPVNTPAEARGGLIGRRHHYSGNGFVPYGGGVGGGFLSGILQDQAQEPQRQLMDSKTKPTAPKPQSSPVGEAMQIANFGKMGKGAYDWAGKQLAGEASPTGLAGATGDTAAGLGGGSLAGDVGGGTGAILGDVGADVAGGAAADTVAGLGADLAVDAAAPEMMAGLAGGEGAAEFLPFLFLKNGGAAQGRRHFDGENGSYVDPEQTTVVSKGNKLPKVPVPDNRPGPEDALVSSAPTRAPKGGVAPSSSFSMPDFSGLVPQGVKDTLTSENFLVPALAGIGSMLASPNKTLLGAVGSGLVGGTTAYTNLEKQQNEMMAKRVEMMKNVFSGPFFSEDGKTQYWRMAGNPNRLTREQYNAAASKFLNIPGANGVSTQAPPQEEPRPSVSAAGKPQNEAVEIARGTTVEPAPKPRETAPAVAAGAPAPAPAAASNPAPAAAAPTSAATPATVSAPPAATATMPAAAALNPAITKAALVKQALAPGSTAFDGLPASKDPRVLQPKIDAYNQRIDELNATIQRAQSSPEAITSPEGEKQITLWQNSLNNLKAQRDDLAKTMDASVDSVVSVPLAMAVKDAETRAEQQAKLDFLGPTKAAELKAELEKRGVTDPLDVKKEVDVAVAKAQGLLPTEYDKIAFTKNIDRQSAAQEKAYQMAGQGQQLVNQAHAYMKAVTDKDGNIVVSGGPLGSKFATASQVLQQMGFSPKFAQDLTGTDPNAAGASKKLQASFASEMARLDLEKSPAVREFSTYMNTSPGVDLPEKTLVWLMNNVIVPKAESMKKGYLAVASLKPEKDNIERALFDYNETNPWFSQETAPTIAGGRAQGAQTTQPARRDVPAGTPPNLIEQELRKRAAQGRQ